MAVTTSATEQKPMPAGRHAKAAESHDAAAKTLRMAEECHQKGDHKAGAIHADHAVNLSHTAHEATKGASAASKTAAH